MKCNYCGTTIPEGNKKCNGCGKKVEIETKEENKINEEISTEEEIIEEELSEESYEEVEEQVEKEKEEDVYEEEYKIKDKNVIDSYSYSLLGMIFPIIGFIFIIIALNKASSIKDPKYKEKARTLAKIVSVLNIAISIIII